MDVSSGFDLALPVLIAVFATALVWGQEWLFQRQREHEELDA